MPLSLNKYNNYTSTLFFSQHVTHRQHRAIEREAVQANKTVSAYIQERRYEAPLQSATPEEASAYINSQSDEEEAEYDDNKLLSGLIVTCVAECLKAIRESALTPALAISKKSTIIDNYSAIRKESKEKHVAANAIKELIGALGSKPNMAFFFNALQNLFPHDIKRNGNYPLMTSGT